MAFIPSAQKYYIWPHKGNSKILLLGEIIDLESLVERAHTLHVPILLCLFCENNFMQILFIMA